MAALANLIPLACDGCFVGMPAVLSFILAVVLLIGSLYMLLASNFGARLAYLIVMVSLMAFMMFLSLLWTIGGPGTTTGTGPRGREPAWVPFKPDSDLAKDFESIVDQFPGDGWEVPAQGDKYPGGIDPNGELTTVGTAMKAALANESLLQRTSGKPYTVARLEEEEASWNFRRKGAPALTPEEKALPEAVYAFYQIPNEQLLFGVQIPATSKHRAVTVFAYRDKGLVFLYSLYFFVISLLLFLVHMWLLTRYERKQKERDAELEPSVPVGAGV